MDVLRIHGSNINTHTAHEYAEKVNVGVDNECHVIVEIRSLFCSFIISDTAS